MTMMKKQCGIVVEMVDGVVYYYGVFSDNQVLHRVLHHDHFVDLVVDMFLLTQSYDDSFNLGCMCWSWDHAL